MKKFLIPILFAFFALPLVAQNTSVSATITDSDDNAWSNGTYTITFNNPSQSQPPVYIATGQKIQTVFKGSLDSSGAFSVSIPDNYKVDPRGTWNFQLCSNTSAACTTITSLTVTGTSMSLTSVLSASVIAPRFDCLTHCYGYGTVEASGYITGSTFSSTKVGNIQPYWWNGTAWVSFQNAIGGPFLPLSGGTMTGALNVPQINTFYYANNVSEIVSDLASISSAGGGTLYISDGNYVLTSGLSVPSNTTLKCLSWKAHFTMPGTFGTTNMVTLSGVTNVAIRGCFFDATGMLSSTDDTHIIRVVNSSNIDINGNYLLNSPEDAIRTGQSTGGDTVSDVRIENNQITSPGQQGISGSGIGSDSLCHSVIVGNTIVNPLLDGVDIEPLTGSCGDHNVITGNMIYGSSPITTGNGVSLFAASVAPEFNTVSGNTIQGFYQAACVVMNGSLHNTITGNTMTACVLGVQVKNTSQYNNIVGNNFDSNITGISFESSSSHNDSRGNVITNSSTGVQEITSANNDSSDDIFALNTSNVGSVSSTFSLVQTGGGGYNIATQGQIIGASVNEGGSVIKLLPYPSSGAYNPSVPNRVSSIIGTTGMFIGAASATGNGLFCTTAGTCNAYGTWIGFSTTKYPHFIATGSPSIVCSTGAGATPPTGAACQLTAGSNDDHGTVTVTTTASPASNQTIFTLTLANACPTGVAPTARGANQAAAQLTGNTHDYPANTGSPNSWRLVSNATGLTASTTYVWNYNTGCY